MDQSYSSDHGASDFPPPIIFNEAGETETSEVTGFSEGPSKFQPEPVTIVNLETERGEKALWLNTAVLRSKVGRLRPKVGETLSVTYLGKRQGASAEYRDYRVEVRGRKPFEPDWSALSSDLDAEPEP